MSRQRNILPQVVERIRQDAPECAIALAGSVRYGYERPDSDIDLLVAVPDFRATEFAGAKLSHETNEARVANFFVGDKRVEIVYFDFAYFDQVQQTPWRSYTLCQAEILHDPEGRFTHCQHALREWFQAHPRITNLWDQQLQMCRQYALTGRPPDRKTVLAFPRWEDFAQHVDALVQAEAARPNTDPEDAPCGPSTQGGGITHMQHP